MSLNELALLAEVPESQVNEIFRAAGVMFGITLTVCFGLFFSKTSLVFPQIGFLTPLYPTTQGLALGFVLLRVESLVEQKD